MPHDAAISALRTLLGDRLATSDSHLDQHAQNEAYYAQALPDAVAYPETTAEVAEIVRICNTHDCPITAFAAASSLEGQHLAIHGGISLDMNRMNQVLAINAEDLNCVVQPGITREALNTDLRATGLFFPIDPGANASIGGMAATRASGTTAVRYGTMRENVLALEAVMADGSIIRTGSQARKSATGYDLTHLLVGSEGTLGILTEVTLRLQGQPEAVRAATCRFDSIEDAVNCVIVTIQSGIPMARIELVDEMMVRGFNLQANAGLPEKPHLFLEFHGSPAAVTEQAANFAEIAEDFGVTGFVHAEKPEDRNRLWAMRHGAHYATQALEPGKRTLSTDVCVPISKLAEAVTSAQQKSRALGLTCSIVGHVGDGNFHCGVRVDPDDPQALKIVKGFVNDLNDMALALGGTVSGEHGIGIGKQAYMAREHGPALAFMRAIKTAYDPKNILNPGKLLPPGNM
ncbi:FAD-linked oxidase C-terminal domain-containing protein [Marinovum sp. 2_MG-2023]|uniref:FAD-binding oxidoreductase n=1 Tax=Roseobacteraceae TaxID=2854170 RepID=UPI001FD1E3FF|nr:MULTISPECIES: FAD-linked oxidase C-terminal domain-containing protein [Roseobacteraceae]MCJ7871424.1 FAD-binding protein [Phaeobacter sp. J2-8]MDO6732780.1 FAD-linked oxidase C-terminal domain-containing protein [Marinovum sp. 2_MG-2023]MDO6781880.1 FAD-linked oxidase C-terminal domain-containing protein [Marinovum sp. 1_MG-2023]